MDQALSTQVPARRSALTTFLKEALQTALLIGMLFFGIRGLVQNFRVDGPSMNPTLSSGEFLWVNKAAYLRLDDQYVLGGGPQRGDIAVLRDPAESIDLIKRIIGLPGDRLLIEHGHVFINGNQLDEPYIRFSASYTYPDDGQPIVIPSGQYFVLGDNRPNSRDSHMGWFVPADDLIGRATLSYWPPADWGIFPSVAYANS